MSKFLRLLNISITGKFLYGLKEAANALKYYYSERLGAPKRAYRSMRFERTETSKRRTYRAVICTVLNIGNVPTQASVAGDQTPSAVVVIADCCTSMSDLFFNLYNL